MARLQPVAFGTRKDETLEDEACATEITEGLIGNNQEHGCGALRQSGQLYWS